MTSLQQPTERWRAPAERNFAVSDAYYSDQLERFKPLLASVRAWMVVIPADGLLLLTPLTWNIEQWRAVLAMAALSVVLLTGGERYRARLTLGVLDDLPTVTSRMLVAAAVVATVIATRHEQEAVAAFLIGTVPAAALLVLGRAASTQLILYGRRRGLTSHPAVVIGTGPVARELTGIIDGDRRYGLSVVGFVDSGPRQPDGIGPRHVGELSELGALVTATGSDVIIVADGAFAERDLLDLVRTRECQSCDLLVVPRVHQFHTRTSVADHIGSIPIMRIRTPSLRGPARVVKRLFDIAFATVVLFVTTPLLAVCALAVRIEGGPGVIFRQPRVGQDGIIFECLKLRTMRPTGSQESATNWSIAGDTRVGPVGRFLRRSSIDELPQMWNVLRGDMSVVGPRPERPYFVRKFSEEFDRYQHRHRVHAGLTGLAQVSGLRGNTSIASRARFDNYYIENWTLWLDIKIILRTFNELLRAGGR